MNELNNVTAQIIYHNVIDVVLFFQDPVMKLRTVN